MICAGVALAGLLHLGQVWLYLGSWEAVENDLLEAARSRSFFQAEGAAAGQHVMDLLPAIMRYQRFVSGSTSIGLNLPGIALAMLGTGLLIRRRHEATPGGHGALPRWDFDTNTAMALVTAYGASLSWLLLMRQHAIVHVPWTARHFLVLLVMVLLTIWPLLRSLVERLVHDRSRLLRTIREDRWAPAWAVVALAGFGLTMSGGQFYWQVEQHFEEWGELGDFDFGDLEAGLWLSRSF